MAFQAAVPDPTHADFSNDPRPVVMAHSHGDGSARVHVTSPMLLLSIYGALLVLTGITVGVTLFDFGEFNVWVALAIAVIKAGLVAMYFMHLRWDSPFNGIVLISSLFFVALFIGISVLDTKEYQVFYNAPGTSVRP